MKDINLMFNSAKPDIHFIVSAGQSIEIKTPGIYNIVPINLDKIVAGYTSSGEPVPNTLTESSVSSYNALGKSVLELNQPTQPEVIEEPLTGGNPVDILFTQNLSKLLADTRYK